MQPQLTLDRDRETTRSDKDGYGTAAKALMGAAAGAVGTFALDRADWAMWNHEEEGAKERTNNVRPHGEPPAHVAARKLEEALALELTPEQHEIAGVVIHYGIGISPAIPYAILRDQLPVRGIPRGLLFGAGLFLAQDEGLNSVSGLGAKPGRYPWQAHVRGLVAHLAYGVVTELMLNFMEKSVKARRIGAVSGSDAQGAPRAGHSVK